MRRHLSHPVVRNALALYRIQFGAYALPTPALAFAALQMGWTVFLSRSAVSSIPGVQWMLPFGIDRPYNRILPAAEAFVTGAMRTEPLPTLVP